MNQNVMKIKLQRLIQVWVEETYDIEDLSEETFDKLRDCEICCYEVEPLWETQEDLGPIQIYDDDWNLIKEYE